MRAIELRAHGFDGLVAADRPIPQLGPGQILIQLKAASVNYRDLVVVLGPYRGAKLPVVPLSDGVGAIVEVMRFDPHLAKGGIIDTVHELKKKTRLRLFEISAGLADKYVPEAGAERAQQ